MFWRRIEPQSPVPIQYWVIGGYLKDDQLRTYFISTQKNHGHCHECVDGPFSRSGVRDALNYWRAVHGRRPDAELSVLDSVCEAMYSTNAYTEAGV